ncbi:choice-of-anchor D domain-containing protein [Adhaeribacter pallidiroseus]|uniref:choice-of-anchor D domain-containing protein n=1 Tax=Adhaeribacter pallidiroseus TaxID=2072847 RepID=UPI0013140B3C|nr:choice-of-anchor D domain-containing protein [Adhaeribacter pallidiroseus]
MVAQAASGQTPEINVRINTTNKPSTSTHTFANQNVNTTSNPPVTFTIENLGTTNLAISGVTLSGPDANQFTLTTTGVTAEVIPGATTTFTANFAPKNITPSTKNAVITIASNDADESAYTINVTGNAFIYNGAITTINPAAGAAIGATVTINGNNLINTTGVTFNGVAATFTIVSTTRVTAVVPAGATTGLISVTNPVGTVSSAQPYNIIPKITSFTPTIAATGSTITINGTSFTGATSVKFNGLEAASFVVNSSTKITAVVPANATTGQISVTTPSGTGTSAASFTPSPAITSITGPGGSTSATVGNTVTINGTSFTPAATVKFVDKNGNALTAPKNYVNNTQLTAVVPLGAVTGLVTVTTNAGAASATFTIANTTYTWNKTTGDWTEPTNWTPARSTPAGTDILLFDGTVTPTATVNLNFATSETVGYLGVIGNATITFSVAADKILNIDNNVSEIEDFNLANLSKLIVTNSVPDADLVINLMRGETGLIGGGLEFRGTGSAEHRLIANNSATNGNTLVFQSNSTFTAAGNFTGSPFGSDFNNSVQFSSNATYYNQSPAGGSPFGNSSSSAVIVFDPNTIYRHDVNTPLDLLNRTYGSININLPAFNQTATGVGNLTLQRDLILTNATAFNLNLVGNIIIGRNITVTRGNLNFNSTSTTIRLDGSGASNKNGAIQGGATTGTINLGTNAHLIIEAGAIVTATKTVAGTGRVSISGTVRTGTTNTAGLSGSATTPFANTLQPLNFNVGSVAEYNGTGSQAISGENYSNLTISGVRTAGSVITLPGTLRISGTFTVAPTGATPSYNTTLNNSTIDFNGDDQIIPAFDYNNVVISGTDDKILGDNVIISGNLSMAANKLYTYDEGNNYNLILGDNATISGEAAGRYVVGNLSTTRDLTSSGSDFGNIGILIGLGPLGSQDLGPTVVNRISGPNSSVLVGEYQGINRTWEVQPTNQPTAPINVTLFWVADDDNGKDLTTARVWKTEGDDPDTYYDVSKTNQNVVNNRRINATIYSFSIFTVSDQNNPLPVELSSFEVAKKGSTAVLTWQTATEKNNQGFAIEISEDARTYKEVGFVKSLNSNSSTPQSYAFTHRAIKAGTFYYRLKQTDWSGATRYYGPKAITFDQVIPALAVFPNPLTSNTPALSVLVGSSVAESVDITVTDVLGKVVYRRSVIVNPAQNEVKVDLNNQAAGVYIIRVISPSTGTNQTRIVKQ